MTCVQCAKALPGRVAFCPKCGRRTAEERAKASAIHANTLAVLGGLGGVGAAGFFSPGPAGGTFVACAFAGIAVGAVGDWLRKR